ncbi:MAG: O-antigen ligase family protein [Bacteroidia bacterium]|nr:O-antigen ligase family protein [Bacteroidia bacterium]
MATNNYIKVLYNFFPVFIAFILPFGNALSSPLIGLWLVSALFSIKGNFVNGGWKSKEFLALITFFILTCISNFVFYNPNDAFSAVEVKLSFLFFPVLFFLFKIELSIAKRIIGAFVSGCHFACWLCIAQATYYLIQGDSSHFYYSNFSWFMHSAYFAMYLNLALLFVCIFYLAWFKSNLFYKRFSIYLISLFSICIVLCASKIGIAVLFTVVPVVLLVEFRKSIKFKHLAIIASIIFVTVFSIYQFVPQVFDRIKSVSVVSNTNIDKTSTESSSVRILIWEESVEIIKNNFLFGVGVSKANETLYKAYEEHGLQGALEKKLNAHNQFFQTFIGIGVIGFLLLFLITVGVIYRGVRTKNIILAFFGVLVTVNFLVESMLQTSAGTVFYVFFFCFLLTFKIEDLKNEKA